MFYSILETRFESFAPYYGSFVVATGANYEFLPGRSSTLCLRLYTGPMIFELI